MERAKRDTAGNIMQQCVFLNRLRWKCVDSDRATPYLAHIVVPRAPEIRHLYSVALCKSGLPVEHQSCDLCSFAEV